MQKLKFPMRVMVPSIAMLLILLFLTACSSKATTTAAVTQHTTTTAPVTQTPVPTSQTPKPTTTTPLPSTTAPMSQMPSVVVIPTTPPPTTSSATGPAVTLNLSAQGLTFDKNSLTVKAGSSVSLVFNNQDAGIPHNVSIYQNLSGGQTKAIFVGSVINGPSTVTYNFTAPAAGNTYFFECDIHTFMNGTFVVTP